MRRMLLLLIKAATSILLLYISLRWVNVKAMADRLARCEPEWIVAALVLMTTQITLLTARWQKIARACGASLTFVPALQMSFIAAFLNQVLPSTVGGDGVRIWLLARTEAGWARATYSVFIDRLVGVFVLALVVTVCLPWTFDLIHEPIARAVLLMIGAGSIAGTVVFITMGTRLQHILGRWVVTRHLASAARAAAALCSSPRSIGAVIGCSIAIHLLTITAAWCCIKAIAAPVSFVQVLILMPPVLLVSTIPISIAGWGVRESSMIVAFALAGLSESDGLTLSILFGATSFVVGLTGGIVWIVSGLRLRSLPDAPISAKNAAGP
jgi:hypothetical protein